MASAWLPAQLLHVAAQFASADPWKSILACVRVRPAINGGVIIDSSDGQRAFRVVCPNTTWECSEHLLISAKSIKKRIACARYAAIDSDTIAGSIRFTGGKNAIARHLCDIPYLPTDIKGNAVEACDYPNLDQIWPDSFSNRPEILVAFDACLLADFLAEVKRYSANCVTRMQLNSPTQPMYFTSDIDDEGQKLKSVMMEFLLMPVQVRG